MSGIIATNSPSLVTCSDSLSTTKTVGPFWRDTRSGRPSRISIFRGPISLLRYRPKVESMVFATPNVLAKRAPTAGRPGTGQ
jgi:hypothetical protein